MNVIQCGPGFCGRGLSEVEQQECLRELYENRIDAKVPDCKYIEKAYAVLEREFIKNKRLILCKYPPDITGLPCYVVDVELKSRLRKYSVVCINEMVSINKKNIIVVCVSLDKYGDVKFEYTYM